MEKTKLTVAEALEQGYTHYIEEGNSTALDIDDLDQSCEGATLLLLDPEPQHFQLHEGWLIEHLFDECENAESESNIDDMGNRLKDELKASGIDLPAIEKQINEALARYTYYNTTGDELMPPDFENPEADEDPRASGHGNSLSNGGY